MTSRAVPELLAQRRGQQLRWLIAFRLVVVTSVLLPTFLVSLSVDSSYALPVRLLVRFAGLSYLGSLLYASWLRITKRWLTAQAYVQFIGDLLLITYLVHFTGGVASPFSMLYLVVIAIASVLLRRQAGLAVAGVAWLLYAALIVAHHQGWLVASGATGVGNVSTVARLAYALAVHLFGFYGVAVLTSYLGRDVSRVEQQLLETVESMAALEVLHRDVIESMSSGLIAIDLAGHIGSINPAGLAILHLTRPEAIGRQITDLGLISPERWRELTSADHLDERLRDEVELRAGEDRQWIGFSIAELRDRGGERRGYTVIFQDLTESRRLQEQLRRRDRMAAVGELAAGLAHEIGNPLAAISGSVQVLSRVAPPASEQKRLLEILLQESQRLDRTIKAFLRFARPSPRKITEFEVGTLLEESLALLRNSPEVGAAHRIEVDLDPPRAHLQADRDQVSQIFWNLARNAIRAMPKGGALRIIGRGSADDYRLRFEDQGQGMGAEQRARLFHPFQSRFDGGTGIGMAIVYRIVEEHGGTIQVESTPGVGTRIDVALPRVASDQNEGRWAEVVR